ncbi:uncharacterized protein DUF1611 [Stackebrandtia albiflava]|uniref:Uncharacterized protein DUF1611 n=1 Tax=Stackebrandtia albiflava TaxID=406432 RepID=A0A562VGU7_9ACTN|nr:DUF1611 domain-containing protein [Stackebrandtia albiflava]TWJ17102.1 uncharacterized protein DUF1611 [Stackebrandtia albiflava]
MRVFQLPAEQIARLKRTYITRAVTLADSVTVTLDHRPRIGDLAIARVTSIGHHGWIDAPDGRRTTIQPDDLLLVAYGARYAPDQYEAELSDDLGAADLAAKGGMIGKVRSRHAGVAAPTGLDPIGVLCDETGRVRNLAETAIPVAAVPAVRVPTIAVVGTAMNAGKTTTAAALIHGLHRAGLRVAAAKLTGTGAANDPWLFRDSGAHRVLDFTDSGLPGTYRVPVEDLVLGAAGLHRHLSAGSDVIVVEIADGLLHGETAGLIRHPVIRDLIDGYVFAAGDAAGALFGVNRLRQWGMDVLATSGVFTQSPLATREAAVELDIPVYTPTDLASASLAGSLLQRCSSTDAAVAATRKPARPFGIDRIHGERRLHPHGELTV